MADWEYKEADWENPVPAKLDHFRNPEAYLEVKGFGYGLEDGYPIEVRFDALRGTEDKVIVRTHRQVLPREDGQNQVDEFNSKSMMDFTTWLGHHSREGWEIFKISRESRRGTKATWCVFRRPK